MVAGRIELMLKRTSLAKKYFSQALQINPRVRVQKELGWISLEEEHYPQAISMLSDHLQREPADFEAFSLLLQCFYQTGRYEVGLQLAEAIIKQKPNNSCFINNRFLFRLLDSGSVDHDLEKDSKGRVLNPFARFNFEIATELPSSWDKEERPLLKSKLLFQDFRFGITHKNKKKDGVCLKFGDQSYTSLQMSLISVGRMESNDIQLDKSGISRRHAVILNFLDDVWVYDLDSLTGTKIDGQSIHGKTFLDGAHDISIGTENIHVAIKESLLI